MSDVVPGSRLGNKLLVTVRARVGLRRLVAQAGAQHLVVSWPAGVTAVPAAGRVPGPYEVIVGHVAGCPMYADLRQLALFRRRRVLIDLPEPAQGRQRPLFHLISAPARTAGRAA